MNSVKSTWQKVTKHTIMFNGQWKWLASNIDQKQFIFASNQFCYDCLNRRAHNLIWQLNSKHSFSLGDWWNLEYNYELSNCWHLELYVPILRTSIKYEGTESGYTSTHTHTLTLWFLRSISSDRLHKILRQNIIHKYLLILSIDAIVSSIDPANAENIRRKKK